MAEAPQSNAEPARGVVASSLVVPLAITVVAQALTALAIHSAVVISPIVALDLGVLPERISLFVMIAYFAAMLAGLACSDVITRFGPLRTVQIALLSAGLGLALGALGVIPTLVVTATLLGLGHGLVGPVSSHILVERTPQNAYSFVLSIKQTGVPIGGAIAGAIIPLTALAIGWGSALVATAFIYLLIALVLQVLRTEYDARRARAVHLSVAGILGQMKASLALTWTNGRLRDLSLACFAYVAIQGVVLTFMVSFLHVRLGFPLVIAGFVFSVAALTGIPGRVFWGAVADRMENPVALLGWLGVAMGGLALVIATWNKDWPIEIIFVVSLLFGATGVSWNGLFNAEVARSVKLEDVSRATGGGQFIGFFGGMIAPVLFDLIATATTSYRVGYAVLALVPLAAGLRLILGPLRIPARSTRAKAEITTTGKING